MARASVQVDLRNQGASLQTIARELRRVDDAKVTALFARRLGDAAKPFVPAVRAAALAIPTTGEKHTGLRARIAACAASATWTDPAKRLAGGSVYINPKRMPPREMGLPLYMQGVEDKARHNRWRHPVFGRSKDPWVQQAAHPFFYTAARGYGPAARRALESALNDVTRQING